MTIELVFESRLSFHLLRQEGSVESEPEISLHLELTSGPKVYASDGAAVNQAGWRMRIHRHGRASAALGHTAGHIAYTRAEGKPRCVIEVQQSPERYDALLDMFKDGYVSEITVLIDGLADQPDYSKKWDTATGDRLTIKAICFEFPLPQSEA